MANTKRDAIDIRDDLEEHAAKIQLARKCTPEQALAIAKACAAEEEKRLLANRGWSQLEIAK